MDHPIVIELGDLTSSPDEVRVGRRSGFWRRRIGVFIAVLAALVAGGATPGGYTLDRPLWQATVENYAISDSWLISWDRANELKAIDVSTGAEAWRQLLPPESARVILGASASNATTLGLLVYRFDDISEVGPAAMWTLLVDVRTGRRLGEVPGEPFGWSASGATLVMPDQSQPDCQPEQTCHSIVGIDSRTGAPRWRLHAPIGPGWLWGGSRDRQPPILARIDRDGIDRNGIDRNASGAALVRYDIDTGRVLARTPLSIDTGGLRAEEVLLTGEALITVRRHHDAQGQQLPQATVAYQSLAEGRTWSVDIPAEVYVRTGELAAYACGRWLCVEHGLGITALDPATGITVRTFDGIFVYSLPGLPLIAVEHSGTRQSVSLLDSRTNVVASVIEGRVRVIGRAGEAALVTIYQVDAVRADLARIGPDGSVSRLGSLESSYYCYHAPQLLVCVRLQPGRREEKLLQLTAWRLPI